MKLRILIAFFLLAFLIPPASAATGNIVGTILEVEGQAQITAPGGKPASAIVTMTVSPGDIITTGPASRVYLQLIDNTELTLGENGQLTVDDYNFDVNAPAENRATYSVLRGTFLYVSGLIAKRPDPQVTVNIPVGSIGIRGTKFWGGQMGAAYEIIVGDGEVEVTNKAGKVRLKKGQGTSVKSAAAQPAQPKTWPKEKIDKAIGTVALKNPAAVGERMKQNAERNEMLRSMHREQIIEQRILKEEGLKLKDSVKPEEPKVRERLKRLQEEKARRMSGLPELPAVSDVTKNTANTLTRATSPVKATVETTLDTTRAATGTAADATARTVDTVTETTKTVIEKVDGTVQTTVEKVTETVDKPVQNTTDIVKETTKPVTDTTGKILRNLHKD